MCSMGINGVNRGYYGRMSSFDGTSRRGFINPRAAQQTENKKKAGKVVLGIAAIIAAIKFRKPIGKVIAPAVNAFKTKFPNFSNALSAVKGRMGRIFGKIKGKIPEDLPKKAAGAVADAARDTVEFTKDKVIPNVRTAANNAAKYTNETIKPNVMQRVKSFLEKVAQKANSDLPKLTA